MIAGHPVITLFGSLCIRTGDGGFRLSLSGSTGDVFAYLITYAGRDIRRERLADLFWSESEPARGRAALNTAVWRINKILGGLVGIKLRSAGDLLMLETCDEAEVDTKQLEAAVRAAGCGASETPLDETVRATLARAADNSVGPFLDGSASDWAIVERERLNALHLRALTMLLHDSARHRDYEDALDYGRRILVLDPFREEVQCQVMWLYLLSGQRTHALRQFDTYRRQLSQEMGVPPMAETRALADYIRTDPDGDLAIAGRPNLSRGRRDSLSGLLSAAEESRRNAYQALGHA